MRRAEVEGKKNITKQQQHLKTQREGRSDFHTNLRKKKQKYSHFRLMNGQET